MTNRAGIDNNGYIGVYQDDASATAFVNALNKNVEFIYYWNLPMHQYRVWNGTRWEFYSKFLGAYIGDVQVAAAVAASGHALTIGDNYYDSVLTMMKYWDGTNWYTDLRAVPGTFASIAALYAAFPPSAAYRGWQSVIHFGAGVSDRRYECIKDHTDTYIWSPVGQTGATEWVDSVDNFYDPTASTPPAPNVGDRYISTATANGWTVDNIYEWNGVVWVETPAVQGLSCVVDALAMTYVYNGAAWVEMAGLMNHNSLNALDGGAPNEYYHLSLADYTSVGGLIEAVFNLNGIGGAPVSILPAGSVPAVFGFDGVILETGGGGVAQVTGNLTPGNTMNIYDDGVNILTLEVTVAGEVTIAVTAGASTFDVSLSMKWR